MAEKRQSEHRRGKEAERKSLVIHARFSAPEVAAVKLAAEQVGITLSAFIRSLTLEGAGVKPFLNDEDRAIFDLLHNDLRAIGTNLNNLVRSVHRGPVNDPRIITLLRELRPVVAAVGLELGKLASRGSQKHRAQS